MFDQILKDVHDSFGENIYEISEPDWEEKARSFLAWLSIEMGYVFSAVKAVFSDEVFSHSQIDYLYPRKPAPCICTIRIEPSQHLAGSAEMSLEVSLYSDTPLSQPDLSFEFQLFGDHGFNAFRTLYSNYRRTVGLLLEQVSLEFETNRPNERVDKYRGKSIVKKLDLYFSEPDDDETIITLRSEFNKDAKPENILRAFFILIAIYDSCYHCSGSSKKIDKILMYYRKLK